MIDDVRDALWHGNGVGSQMTHPKSSAFARTALPGVRSLEVPFRIIDARTRVSPEVEAPATLQTQASSRLSRARLVQAMKTASSGKPVARYAYAARSLRPQMKRIPLLSPPVGGRAGLDYQVVVPSIKKVVQDLEERLGRKTIQRLAILNKFRSCLLNLRVEMANPSEWALEWARFNFQLASRWASALSFAPATQGIAVLVKKSGSRAFLLSASGTIGADVGPSVGGKLRYDSSRGWQVEYSAAVDEVKGSSQKNSRKEQEIVWDLYRDQAIGVPDAGLGSTVTVPVVALIRFPRNREDPVVTVTAEGRTRRIARGVLRRRYGIIETTSVGGFSLKPTL